MGKYKNKTSFARQAAILAAASLFVRFIGFIYRVPLTALIGDIGNGIYSTGYNIYNFFLVVSSAGIPAAISKMVSERIALKQYKNAHKVFRISLLITITSGILGAIIMWFGAEALANMFHMPKSFYAIRTLAPTVFMVAIMSSYRGYFQGMRTTTPTAVSQIVEQIFNAVFSIVLAHIWFKKGLEIITSTGNESIERAAAGGTMGTGIGALAGLFFLIFAYIIISPEISKRQRKNNDVSKEEDSLYIAKTLLKISLTIVAGTAIISVTNLIDMQMVMDRLLFSGKPQEECEILYGQLTGKYSTLTTLPVALSTAFATATVPNIAAAVVLKDRLGVRRKINTSLRLTMLISIPAAIGIGVLGDHIIGLLFPTFPDGGNLLKIGAASIIFLSLTQITTGTLQGIGKAHFPVIAIGLGALTKIILNYFLIAIPKINVAGSVIGTTGCYLVASLLDLWALTKYTRIKLDYRSIFIKPLLSASVMGLSCFLLYKLSYIITSSNNISTIISILVAIIVYAVVLLLIKGLTLEDISLFPFGENISQILIKLKLI